MDGHWSGKEVTVSTGMDEWWTDSKKNDVLPLHCFDSKERRTNDEVERDCRKEACESGMAVDRGASVRVCSDACSVLGRLLCCVEPLEVCERFRFEEKTSEMTL